MDKRRLIFDFVYCTDKAAKCGSDDMRRPSESADIVRGRPLAPHDSRWAALAI